MLLRFYDNEDMISDNSMILYDPYNKTKLASTSKTTEISLVTKDNPEDSGPIKKAKKKQ